MKQQKLFLSWVLVSAFNAGTFGTAWADGNTEGEACNGVMMGKSISSDWLDEQLARIANQDPSMTRLQTAVRRTSMNYVSINEEILKNHNSDYTLLLRGLSVTDQKQTGRCWVFSAQTVFRTNLIASGLLMPNFEISENYVWFYALLERSNYFIEELMKKTYQKMKPSELQYSAIPRISEGGFFVDFVEVVKKYGIVPKEAMPETSGSMRSGVTEEIDLMLSEFALEWTSEKKLMDALKKEQGGALSNELKGRFEARLRSKKEQVMKGVFQILTTHLGVPPKEFNLRLAGKASNAELRALKKEHANFSRIMVDDALDVKMTPMDLLDLSGFAKEEWVTVSYFPQKPFGRAFDMKGRDGITRENGKAAPLRLLNLPMKRMIELTEAVLKEGYPVEFDSNVGAQSEFGHGIMHPDLYDTDPVYGKMVDRKKLQSRENSAYLFKNQATHAMAIVGFDQPDPKKPPIKFLVQNSWGPLAGEKGYLHMYREWMENFVENINVPKRLLTAEELKALENPIQAPDYGWFYRK